MTSTLTVDGERSALPIFPSGEPMSGDDYLALGETSPRVELFDGSLLVTPNPLRRHQRISRRLANILETGVDPHDLEVDEGVNVRLTPNSFVIPDVVVSSLGDDTDDLYTDAALVVLVCEVLSPSNTPTDTVLKKHYYAVAGIPWYLIVDPRSGTLFLHELVGSAYQEHSVTKAGQILRLTEPVRIDLDPAELLPD